jgi:hypothetical protein
MLWHLRQKAGSSLQSSQKDDSQAAQKGGRGTGVGPLGVGSAPTAVHTRAAAFRPPPVTVLPSVAQRHQPTYAGRSRHAAHTRASTRHRPGRLLCSACRVPARRARRWRRQCHWSAPPLRQELENHSSSRHRRLRQGRGQLTWTFSNNRAGAGGGWQGLASGGLACSGLTAPWLPPGQVWGQPPT